MIEFNTENISEKIIEVFSIDGKLLTREKIAGQENVVEIGNFGTENSIYICNVVARDYNYSFKIKL